LPAALECASRAIAVAVPVAEAFVIVIEEARTATIAEALIFAEGLADTLSDTVAEAVADPEAFPDPQTFSISEARRRAGQRRG
jgi:hypothetical protein